MNLICYLQFVTFNLARLQRWLTLKSCLSYLGYLRLMKLLYSTTLYSGAWLWTIGTDRTNARDNCPGPPWTDPITRSTWACLKRTSTNLLYRLIQRNTALAWSGPPAPSYITRWSASSKLSAWMSSRKGPWLYVGGWTARIGWELYSDTKLYSAQWLQIKKLLNVLMANFITKKSLAIMEITWSLPISNLGLGTR